MGLHIHLALYWPDRFITRLVAVVERLTGAPVNPGSEQGAAIGKSYCGGWLLERMERGLKGALGWTEDYLAKQEAKHGQSKRLEGYQVGTSLNIGKGAQERAGWSPPEVHERWSGEGSLLAQPPAPCRAGGCQADQKTPALQPTPPIYLNPIQVEEFDHIRPS